MSPYPRNILSSEVEFYIFNSAKPSGDKTLYKLVLGVKPSNQENFVS